ncbi:hypothetical protein KM043_017267 [Ampulex compressa]|nr:hypothetical protein KM043_017267 [Ampulex compressa]
MKSEPHASGLKSFQAGIVDGPAISVFVSHTPSFSIADTYDAPTWHRRGWIFPHESHNCGPSCDKPSVFAVPSKAKDADQDGRGYIPTCLKAKRLAFGYPLAIICLREVLLARETY